MKYTETDKRFLYGWALVLTTTLVSVSVMLWAIHTHQQTHQHKTLNCCKAVGNPNCCCCQCVGGCFCECRE